MKLRFLWKMCFWNVIFVKNFNNNKKKMKICINIMKNLCFFLSFRLLCIYYYSCFAPNYSWLFVVNVRFSKIATQEILKTLKLQKIDLKFFFISSFSIHWYTEKNNSEWIIAFEIKTKNGQEAFFSTNKEKVFFLLSET